MISAIRQAGMAAVLLTASLPAMAQQTLLAPTPESAASVLLRLAVVIGLIVAFAYIARALQARRRLGGQSFEIQGGLTLGGKERLMLVKVGETQLLLGVTPGGISLLHRYGSAEEVPVEPAPLSLQSADGGGDFAERFREVLRRSVGA